MQWCDMLGWYPWWSGVGAPCCCVGCASLCPACLGQGTAVPRHGCGVYWGLSVVNIVPNSVFVINTVALFLALLAWKIRWVVARVINID